MPPEALHRLVVDLESGEQIAGFVVGDDLRRRRFDGLLELVALLEHARRVPPREDVEDDEG